MTAIPSHPLPPGPSSSSLVTSLDRIRQLTPGQYIIRSGVEGAAVSLVATPGYALFYFLDGLLSARYPRGYGPSPSPPGPLGSPLSPPSPHPASPRTFPALFQSAALYCVTCTFRTGVWVVLAAGGAAALREGVRVGPRHQPPREALEDGRVLACNAGAGALAAGGVTWDWVRVMGGGRWAGYCALGGVMGALLPVIFAKLGPKAKERLQHWVPKGMEGGEGGGGGGGGGGGVLK